jgi:hypothetical protein
MKRGTLIAAVVLAIGAFACERKHDDKAGETTTTSGTVHEEQSTGGTGYNYQGSPGVTGGGTQSTGNDSTDVSGAAGASTGTERNAQPTSGSSTGSSTSMGTGGDVSGSSLAADQSGSTGAKDAGIASDFEKKDGGHIAPSTGTSKAKSGDNKSTTLGDGTSGQYTGGKGTYGGKATQGTGEKK